MRRKALISAALVAVLSAGAAGCITSERKFPGPKRVSVDKDAYFFGTDATRRYVMTVERDTPGSTGTRRITCAEPSPDVAVATAEAFSAALKADGKGPSGAGDAEGKIGAGVAASAAESIAQLGARTATIQLLRDNLYRACEAYANGAIDESMYALIISRIDDVMVTLLTAEIMGGASAELARLQAPSVSAGVNLLGGEGDDPEATSANSDTQVGPNPQGGGGRGGLSYGGAAKDDSNPEDLVKASTAGFVQLHSNYLNDVNANRTSLGVACLAALNNENSAGNATLRDQCITYMQYAMPAAFGIVKDGGVRLGLRDLVAPPGGAEYLETHKNENDAMMLQMLSGAGR